MIESNIQPVLDWIIAHPGWAGMAVFILSLSESLAVVGLFIPGILVMSMVGGLVTAGILKLSTTLLWAILGAIFGDGISYSIGRKFKHNLNIMWPFNKFPHWLGRGRSFFVKHGSLSVIIGRFVGPVRPFIPVVAGIMAMCPRRFFVANVLSAIAWAPIYMSPGMIYPYVKAFFKFLF